jgi:GTPase SAR1 family protein
MKTEIQRFCATCLEALAPLPPALATAAAQLEKSSDPALFTAPLNALHDLRARLRSLTDKLGNQQAYLLIFGPLKSGKSTLMNAISGSYVSEVTSLPGYPCLVYVQHADDPHFSVTRYNGRESVFANGVVLKEVIADSHVALADQIRVTEARGDSFDPRTHFTEAIRRIDIKVPVPALAESSTVLVDTPGLYSRMNFGYDVLTREFRNSAACAVFVVKTDNLFLEQVFAEFNQLLDLFSRIFLVINVDSSKRDLLPDGSLQPSAESYDPAQIIEAFKTLSMAGPLRAAYEAKRVRLHAVDLLSAAAAILTPNGSAPAAKAEREAFIGFQRDLTDYLNSSDYTVEFIRDSLHQGGQLCAEARALATISEFAQLRDRQDEIASELLGLDDRLSATDRLLAVDWDAAFAQARAAFSSGYDGVVRARVAQLSKDLRGALDRWLGSTDSLEALARQHWNPLLADAGRTLADEARNRLRTILGGPLGGAEPAAATMTDLHTVGCALAPIAQAARTTIEEPEPTDGYPVSLKPDEIPVQKTFVDWLLFRTQLSVRRRVFGEDGALEIAPEVKEQRLREASREALERAADDAISARFPKLPAAYADALLGNYVAKFRTDLLAALRRQRASLANERTVREIPFEANTQLLATMQSLHESAAQVATHLDALGGSKEAAAPAPIPEPEPAASKQLPKEVPVLATEEHG